MIRLTISVVTILGLSSVLAGCGKNNDLSCDGGGAIDTVISIFQKNQPLELLNVAAGAQHLPAEITTKFTAEMAAAQSQCLDQARQDYREKITAEFGDAKLEAEKNSPQLIDCDAIGPDVPYTSKPSDVESPEVRAVEGTSASAVCKHLNFNEEDRERNCPLFVQNYVGNKINEETQKLQNQVLATAVYSLNTIRMEDKNSTTGAVTCAAKLHADIPNHGSADQEIEY